MIAKGMTKNVIPAKAGIHFAAVKMPMDSRLRGNDDIVAFAGMTTLWLSRERRHCGFRGNDDIVAFAAMMMCGSARRPQSGAK
ncbi:MAG TPA: hypothetical protein VN326_00480 [Casimicrobiaceae bacterium]|nr:hypothetical protein [Casimicrobiaceae bacterium]